MPWTWPYKGKRQKTKKKKKEKKKIKATLWAQISAELQGALRGNVLASRASRFVAFFLSYMKISRLRISDKVKNGPNWLILIIFFFFLQPHLQHMEVPRLGVTLELQLLAFATATATQDPSHIFDLCCILWQCWILNPLSEARDWTRVLMDTSWVRFHWATTGTPTAEFKSWSCHFLSVSPEQVMIFWALIPSSVSLIT